MKNLLGKLILIPLFVLILSLMTVTNASAATYNLFGKITKASGGNVSGATIDVLQANTTTVVQSASSNSMGNYTLNVEEGTYDIRVTPPSGQGLGISITEDFQISENSSLNFTLVPPPVTVQGTITDYLGNPLENSSISFQYQPTGTNYGQQTDSNGHYSLQVPTGTFNILIDGTTDNTTSVNIPENWQVGTPDYEITGNATINYSVQVKKIDIHVEDPSHSGVENANIKVNGLTVNDRTLGGANAFGSTSYQDGIETDSYGNATLFLYTTNANDGDYKIVVTPQSGSEYTTTVAEGISLTDDRTLTVTLSLPVEITGVIRDYLGNPLESIFIGFGNDILGSFSTQTDENGHYSINIPKGNFRFGIDGTTDSTPSTVMPENWQIIVNNLNISEGREIDYDLLTKKLEVHVSDSDDQPVENVRIQVNGLTVNNLTVASESAFGSTSYQDGILTDSEGIATLYLYATNSEDGNYTLVLTPPEGGSYTTTVAEDVSLTADRVLPVELSVPVTLSGTITDYLGNPLENSSISLDHLITGISFHPTTDENGYYSIGIPPGNYRMLIDGTTSNTNSNNIPEAWQVGSENISIPNNKSINYTVNVKKVDLHVQNPSDVAIEDALITVNGPTHNDLILDGQQAFGTTAYNNGILTNSSGNATLWLYQTNEEDGGYTITVSPPETSIYTQSVIENVEVPSNLSRVIVLGVEGGNQPTTTTLFPSADTYIKQGSKNENEGASTLLRLQSSGKNRAILAFDEGEIESAIGNSQDFTATLQFTISENGNNWGTNGRTIDLHRMTSNWFEGNGFIVGNSPTYRGTGSGTTWNCSTDSNIANQNDDCAGSDAWEMTSTGLWPFISAPTATTIITNNQSGVVEMDVTTDVEDFLSNTNQNYGWLLKKTDEGANGKIEFGSKESSIKPKLIITTN